MQLPSTLQEESRARPRFRATRPGQHGTARRKPSEYALRLYEKQKLVAHYGLRERQLQKFVSDCRQSATNWISELSRRLELRLDNIIFRMQLAPSLQSARQIVGHGHIKVNGRTVDIPSYVCSVNDEIKIDDGSKEHPNVLQAINQPRLDLPAYLEKADEFSGKIVAEPTTSDVPFVYNDRLIAEYYATRGRK